MAEICLGCGHSVKNIIKPDGDSNSVGWWWLGFFFPVIGFILWAVWSGNYPIKAKKAGIGALVGFIASIVLVVLIYVILFVLMFLGISGVAGAYY